MVGLGPPAAASAPPAASGAGPAGVAGAEYPGTPPAAISLRRNLIANFVGGAWSALASFLAVPLYIHFLGVEAWGLVGFFTVLLTLASLFQVGLGPALTRELARLSALTGTAQEARDLSRTVELLFWAAACAGGAIIAAAAGWIAAGWLRPASLDHETVVRAVQLMGAALAVQLPYSVYSGGLLGLQRQVLLNAVGIAGVTLRTAGAVLVLWRIAPTLEAFFLWQMLASAAQTALGAASFWLSLPSADAPARFSIRRLRTVWRFAGGMAGISILGVILIQMDKVVASRLLSLEVLGYYTLAAVAAGVLYRVGGPVFGTVYPRLTQLVAVGDEAGLASLYHRGSQLLAVLILPPALLAAAFPHDLLLLWTRNSTVAENTAALLALLLCGTALHALMSMPYALQLAHGWTRLGLYTNAASAILLLPLLIVCVLRYGAIGAASVWVLLNVGFFVINVQLMHRRLLPGHHRRWYLVDVGRPLAAALTTILTARFVIDRTDPASLLPWLLLVWLAATASAVLAAPALRSLVTDTVRRRAPA